jgi:hypothetical protein
VQRGRDVIVDTEGQVVDPATLFDHVVACSDAGNPKVQSLVIVPSTEIVQAIETIARARPDGRGPTVAHLGPAEDARSETRSVRSGPDIVVATPPRLIDHIRRGNVNLSDVSLCLVSPPEKDDSTQYSADLHFIYTKFDQPPSTVLYARGGEEVAQSIVELMRRPATISSLAEAESPLNEPEKEHTTMSDLPFDAESAAQQLRDIVKRIHEDEDPKLMNTYRKFIRRHVSVFHRGYFMAYLFKQGVLGEAPAPRSKPQPSANQSSGSMQSVFVSAGRNRRVHARDLTTLFTSVEGVSNDDIGQIKVLDNYSFVEVEGARAQQAIEALNATEFRGRKLTVNFARRK